MDDSWLIEIEKLAALVLGTQERAILRADLTRIIKYAGGLPEYIEGETTLPTTSSLYNQHTEEDPIRSFSRDSYLAGAPDFCDGFHQSPGVLQQPPKDDDA